MSSLEQLNVKSVKHTGLVSFGPWIDLCGCIDQVYFLHILILTDLSHTEIP